jgi:SAM-dependent methyltransferase
MNIQSVLKAAEMIVLLALAASVTQQVRKPSWLLGRLIARTMNKSHAGLTTWGLSQVTIRETDSILDVGCGGGKTIDRMAAIATRGHVSGVDYSTASVAVAQEVNAEAIKAGRVDVQSGSASRLPFAPDTFDLVTAVETHFYWPDLPNDVREVRRVLKPGGSFMILSEAYRRSTKMDWLVGSAMRLIRAKYLTLDEHRRLLEAAGYSHVELYEERSKGWMCAVARN